LGAEPVLGEDDETERSVAEAIVAEAIGTDVIGTETIEPQVIETEVIETEVIVQEPIAQEPIAEEALAEEPVADQSVAEPAEGAATTRVGQLASLLVRLESRLEALDKRLANLERSTDDLRRRDLLWELRTDPSRLIAGIAEIRRVTPEDLDDLAEVLARWDVPLSPAELKALHQTGLVAQGVSGARGAKVHLVVNIVPEVTTGEIERITRTARILSVRSRRAIPILVSLEEPPSAIQNVAIARGVEIALDL
jgi:hypothetical protein